MKLAGRYQLVRRIAAGGMGEVWEAQAHGEHGFVRRVAIKRMILEESSDPAFARMFLDEARIASRLHHANVVAIVDFGVDEGTPFQVLEYVDGIDAQRLVQCADDPRRSLSPELALHICAEVAHGVHHAHEACDENGTPLKIVHRDVSPHNVLVSWNGEVKLTDFGIAFAQGREEKTRAGVTKGKPSYMAPEQAVRGDIDGRTDVFALGCVLHALLTGRSPLAGEDRMADLLAGGTVPVDPSLPDDVRQIVERATRRSRSDRFHSAQELATACAQAARARLHSDPKLALKAHLEGFRDVPAQRGSLDALFDPIASLPGTGTQGDGEVTRTVTRADRPNSRPATGPDVVPGTPTAPAEPPRRKTRAAVAGGALVVTLGLALGAIRPWTPPVPASAESGTAGTPSDPAADRGGRTDSSGLPAGGVDPASRSDARALQSAEPAAGPIGDSSAAGARSAGSAEPPGGDLRGQAAGGPPSSAGATPAGATTGIGAAPVSSGGTDASRKPAVAGATPTQPNAKPNTRTKPPPATVSAPVEQLGVLVIGGEGAIRKEILIDGVSHGFAPKALEVPVGEHTVELRSSDGSAIGRKVLALSAGHTRSSPLRWLVDSPQEVSTP